MNPTFYSSGRRSVAAALLAMVTLSACSDDDNGVGPGATPTAVSEAVAPAASAQVAVTTPGPCVKVVSGSSPASGVLVTFTVTGGGAVQYPIATTDAQGQACAGLWQVGPKVGANTVTATVEGLPPVTFNLASVAGPAAAIGAFAGSGQSGAPGSTLTTPLQVRITDAGGNPKSGTAVTFTVTSGGGTLSTATSTTNASGIAQTNWTLGPGQCGQLVTATAGTLTTTFTGSSRGSTTVGTTAGTLSTTDCLVNGRFADEFNLTTTAGAFNVVGTGALAQVIDLAGNPIAGAPEASFRVIAAAGDKALRAWGTAAGATGPYSISMTSTSDAVTSCAPVYIEIGATTTQTLSPSDCTANFAGVAGDTYTIYLPAGAAVRISQTSNPLDAELVLKSPTGAVLVDRDNAGVSAATPEVINFTASTAGFYTIVATSYCLVFDDVYRAACDYGAYTLSVTRQ